MTKNIETCAMVWDQLLSGGADRHSLILNIGGGVVTDLGAFCASTFQRGIRFINIPTSLLALCDAAVGGKTGARNTVYNTSGGMIGRHFSMRCDANQSFECTML